MAINTTTTTGASAFFASLFSAARLPVGHRDYNDDAEITDWELVNNSDLSDDDDDVIDIISDSESEISSTLVSFSLVNDCSLKNDMDFVDQFSSVAVVGIRAYGVDSVEKKEMSVDGDLVEEAEDTKSEYDELDDELVPWSVGDRFGRQRMRKLGTRAFAKMNKTTKKIAYTVNRPGCVRGKHGLGRKGY